VHNFLKIFFFNFPNEIYFNDLKLFCLIKNIEEEKLKIKLKLKRCIIFCLWFRFPGFIKSFTMSFDRKLEKLKEKNVS